MSLLIPLNVKGIHKKEKNKNKNKKKTKQNKNKNKKQQKKTYNGVSFNA